MGQNIGGYKKILPLKRNGWKAIDGEEEERGQRKKKTLCVNNGQLCLQNPPHCGACKPYGPICSISICQLDSTHLM